MPPNQNPIFDFYIMRKIDRNIISLGWVSFFTDLGSEMIFPILPAFLADVLGISKSLIGLIEGVAESSSSILKVFSGYLSDRFGRRKPIVFAGYSLSAFTKPLIAFANTWQMVLVLRLFDRTGKGIRTSARDAMIADYSKTYLRGRAFGFHRTMDNLGAVLGTLISFLIFSYVSGEPYRTVFLLSALPGALAVGTIMFFVKEQSPDPLFAEDKVEFSLVKGLDKRFKFFLGASAIFTFSNFSYVFFLLRAKEVGVSVHFLPLIYLVYNVSYLLFSYPAGILSDKIGRKEVVTTGYIIYFITSLGFAMATKIYQVWLLFVLFGLFHAFTEGVSRAFVSDMADSSKRATALGIYHTIIGITTLPAGIFAGLVWDHFGSVYTFYSGAFISFVAIIVLVFKVRAHV